jgi:ABC-type multidrug transport system fused ATPase/permease subunit
MGPAFICFQQVFDMTMQAFKLLMWPFVAHHWRGMLAMVCLGFANSCCTLLVPLSIGHYMDLLLDTHTGKGRALGMVGIHLPNSMAVFFAFWVGLLLVKLATAWGGRYWADCYADRYVMGLRQQLFDHHLATKTMGRPIDAKALTAYSQDMKVQQQWLVKGVVGLAKDLLFLALALCLLFALQPTLSGIILLFLPIFYWLHAWLNRRLKPAFELRRRQQASLFGFVTGQLIDGALPSPGADGDFRQQHLQWQQTGKGYHRRAALLQAMAPLLLYGMLGILLLAMAMAPGGLLPNSGDVLAYVLLLMMTFPTLRNTVRTQKTWMQAGVSARKFLKIVQKKKDQG